MTKLLSTWKRHKQKDKYSPIKKQMQNGRNGEQWTKEQEPEKEEEKKKSSE